MSIDANEDFTMVFNDSNDEKRMMLFFESGRVTQVRVYDDVKDDKVKCSFVAYSKKHFKKDRIHFLEKEFYRDGCLIQEYYSDGVMDFYFVTKKEEGINITRGYCPKGKVFSSTRKFLDANGNELLDLDVVLSSKD